MFDLSDPKSNLFSEALPWWCTTLRIVIASAFRALLKCSWAEEKDVYEKIVLYVGDWLTMGCYIKYLIESLKLYQDKVPENLKYLSI